MQSNSVHLLTSSFHETASSLVACKQNHSRAEICGDRPVQIVFVLYCACEISVEMSFNTPDAVVQWHFDSFGSLGESVQHNEGFLTIGAVAEYSLPSLGIAPTGADFSDDVAVSFFND